MQRERYLAREREIEESIHTWESSILPDWKAAVRNPTFRKLWWNGVPPKLRGVIWERAFGNALTLSKGTRTSTSTLFCVELIISLQTLTGHVSRVLSTHYLLVPSQQQH